MERMAKVMANSSILNQLAHKLRTPALIVHIAFPLYCWALLAFRWSGLWLTQPWMVAVIVLYYVMAIAYLFFIFITRISVVGIVGLFVVIAACIFVWIPHNWVFALLLIPALFKAFRDKKDVPTAIAFTIAFGVFMLPIIIWILKVPGVEPIKYAYYDSPDGCHVVVEHTPWGLTRGTNVVLHRMYGPLLVPEKTLYMGEGIDFGGGIEWVDQNSIHIYGDTMDVFKDPTIDNIRSTFI